MYQNIGEILILFWRTLATLPLAWRQRAKILDQIFEIGNGSLLMVCILSLFIGGVLALQTGPMLVNHGLNYVLGGMVGLSFCRELGPVLMAILIAGRSGSAMSAEIGSMQVYEEIDALRTMNIDPVSYLVLPRLLAIAVALPTLVLFAIPVGWLGGAVVCATNRHIAVSFDVFFQNLREEVELQDILNGLFKSFVFALAIGVISCHQGLITRGGPRGIGRSVTKAVVNSIVLILILDYFVTRLLIWVQQ
ncbi:MAG: ABC transporter permease [Verrucomicrobiota bacterium]|jgi:phospholipid/cholesterol/gamma-HCH transport system permease protein